jgi:hypothetical protein
MNFLHDWRYVQYKFHDDDDEYDNRRRKRNNIKNKE